MISIDSWLFSFTVVVPGVVIKPAHYQSALTGTNVTFLCESQAGTFEWLKVNTVLQDGTETTISTHKIDQNSRNRIVASFSNGMVTSVLTISNITTTDSGIYECVLRVIHHKHPIEKNTRLYVHGNEIILSLIISQNNNNSNNYNNIWDHSHTRVVSKLLTKQSR